MAFTGTFTRTVNEDLAATGQSNAVHASTIDLMLSGTWAGTAQVQTQNETDGSWIDMEGSDGTFTANAAKVIEWATPRPTRIDWTRTSGTLTVMLEAIGKGAN